MSSHLGQMGQAVDAALNAASTPAHDTAAAQLVRRYAALLDDASGRSDEVDVYSDIGPKLLAALTALGLTLVGRTKGGVRVDAPSGGGKLDELRARRLGRTG